MLPCGDSICQEHLKDAQIIDDNTLTCLTCQNQILNLKENIADIKPIKTIQKLLENEMYLSEEEKIIKNAIQISFRNFQKLYDDFLDSKSPNIKGVFLFCKVGIAVAGSAVALPATSTNKVLGNQQQQLLLVIDVAELGSISNFDDATLITVTKAPIILLLSY